MKKHKLLGIAAVLTLACTQAGLAQAPSGPPKPGPEHQKLAYFVGKWAVEGEMKPSSFGPGGKFTYTETCSWFSGGFAVTCHSDGKTPEGPFTELSILGYDAGEKTYVYFATSSLGENIFSRGSVEGDTWTWANETNMYGKPGRVRFTLKQVSADSATYKLEMSTGDEPLKLVMEGKETRVK